ncbi:MAG: glycoside hydrolase family 3 C-terminal domain-containing protein [Victivallales bacterium]|nr:glycoside hydrolase family 3 C-terminal domain-containing protein [Victivallales bacterium]
MSCCDELNAVEAAVRSIVLLKNEGGALPLSGGERVAFFRPGDEEFIVSGEGSGKVRPSVEVSPQEALEQSSLQWSPEGARLWRHTVRPWYNDEVLRKVRSEAECAVVFISRVAGEGRELYDEPGGLRPSADETDFFQALGRRDFRKKILVLNTPACMSPEFMEHFDSVLWCAYPGQGGSEALLRIISGQESPSGRLTCTWPRTPEAHPGNRDYHEHPEYVDFEEDIFVGYRYFSTFDPSGEKVLFPFGHGLSFTTFSREVVECDAAAEEALKVRVKVTNTGTCTGRETVQLYCKAPQGRLGKAALVLAAFGKTTLLAPGASETVELTAELKNIASYDDTGITGFPHSWVLEAGEYEFFLGGDVREAGRSEAACMLEFPRIQVLERLQSRIPPRLLARRLKADGTYEQLATDGSTPGYRNESRRFTDEGKVTSGGAGRGAMLNFRQLAAHPEALMDAFVAQLSDETLIQMAGGLPSALTRSGTGRIGADGIFGIPAAETTDGPCGVHRRGPGRPTSVAWPAPALLASSWDVQLLHDAAAAIARESKSLGYRIWLAPSMNIQRTPKNGRNFEYFSEDPLLSGKLGAAMIIGAQAQGVAAAPKHFLANSREFHRDSSDSRLSERAAREIYLRNFQIAVTEGRPWAIMSSYNLVNGTETAENGALLQGILRDEWKFDGVIMTDWGNNSWHEKEIAAGNNVKMPSGTPAALRKALQEGYITRKELENCGRYILLMLIRTSLIP